MTRFGAVEAGGTKFVCMVGTRPGDVAAAGRFRTTTPAATLSKVVAFFREHGPVDAVGVASFGPVELRPGHASWGHITATPKPGWQDVDVTGPLRDGLGVPVGFDTDVGGAALGEGRWGAAAGVPDYVYLTVGTGIGAGVVAGGRLVHGLVHPETGHVSVPRQPGDDFAGTCPYHGDCFEGMASGPAMAARWGHPAEQLEGDDLARAVELEAAYVAAGIRNMVYVLAPQRVVLGGGVSGLPGLLPGVRSALQAALAGYPGLPEHGSDEFVVPSALAGEAGAFGAFILAEHALAG